LPSINSLRISLSATKGRLLGQLSAGDSQLTKLKQISDRIDEKFTNRQRPPQGLAKTAAGEFLRGTRLDSITSPGVMAFALNEKIDSAGGKSIVESISDLIIFLDFMEPLFVQGKVLDIYWFGILQSYFQMPVTADGDADTRRRNRLRKFLTNTWEAVYSQAKYKPRWMRTVATNGHLLTDEPALVYADEWRLGTEVRVKALRSELAIPDNSWFWHEFFRSCLKSSLEQEDAGFRASISRLLNLLGRHPSHLDAALRAIFERYYSCLDSRKHLELLDFALDRWGSPRLRNTPANKWSRLSEPAWRMVIGWLNEGNLRLFFELLRRRGAPDPHGRLDFWLGYINQITSTRLVLGDATWRFLKSSPDLSKELSDDNYSLARLTGSTYDEFETDAFIMEIGNHVIVEFNPRGGCYIYQRGSHGFNLDAPKFSASTSPGGLKERYHLGSRGPDLVHGSNWKTRANRELLPRLGIFDDKRAGRATQTKRTFKLSDYF
jgi:hypothetical protein